MGYGSCLNDQEQTGALTHARTEHVSRAAHHLKSVLSPAGPVTTLSTLGIGPTKWSMIENSMCHRWAHCPSPLGRPRRTILGAACRGTSAKSHLNTLIYLRCLAELAIVYVMHIICQNRFFFRRHHSTRSPHEALSHRHWL